MLIERKTNGANTQTKPNQTESWWYFSLSLFGGSAAAAAAAVVIILRTTFFAIFVINVMK